MEDLSEHLIESGQDALVCRCKVDFATKPGRRATFIARRKAKATILNEKRNSVVPEVRMEVAIVTCLAALLVVAQEQNMIHEGSFAV